MFSTEKVVAKTRLNVVLQVNCRVFFYSTNNRVTYIALFVLDFGPNLCGEYPSCKYAPLLFMLPDQAAWLCGEKRYPSLNRTPGCAISPSDLHVFKYGTLKG